MHRSDFFGAMVALQGGFLPQIGTPSGLARLYGDKNVMQSQWFVCTDSALGVLFADR
jgi:hypothetical protein